MTISVDTTANPQAQSQNRNGRKSQTRIPVVFFGRLEERKGLFTFVEAIKSLDPEIKSRIHVHFIGKVVPLSASTRKYADSQQLIEHELAGEVTYQLSSNFFSKEAIAFIVGLSNPIVCLASPQENFPNTALEMGQLPVSLVVSDTGGFHETLKLVNRTSALRWFKPKDARSLSRALSEAIAHYPETPQLPGGRYIEQVNQSLLEQKLNFIETAFQRAIAAPPAKPSVTVGVVYQTGEYLTECLSSLETQTYQDVQVIVFNATVGDPESEEMLSNAQSLFPNFKFIQSDGNTDLSLGAAYNYLVSLTDSEYFLPLNPDYILLPFALEKFAEAAAQSQAAIVTCPRKYFGLKEGLMNFSGGSLPSILKTNLCGDTCSLFSTALLRRFKCIEDQDIHTNTWEVMAAAVATGQKIVHYPYPLYERRVETEEIPNTIASPKDQYYLRQYLSQIPSDEWAPRQIYMLLTAVQQYQSQSVTVTPVPANQAELESLRMQLKETQEKLKQARTRSKAVQAKLGQTQARISAMETSKFWKLRKTWLRVKRTFGLPLKE